MTGRELIIAVIREGVRGIPIADVQTYADALPAHVEEGAQDFCDDYGMGPWLRDNIRAHDISVAHELYQFIEESKLAVVQHKEAETSGDNQHATT
jgi:hypothetical protein